MHRQIVYAGSLPQDTDFLLQNRHAMIAFGQLAQSILGTSTLVSGLGCQPTAPASMQVQIAPGTIYSQQNVDSSAYGSLAAVTGENIMKMGITLDTLNITCAAPASVGQSQVYLVQAAFEEIDEGDTVLPYYNAADPEDAWAGPDNTGITQKTVRQNLCLVNAKAGVAATTGSQAIPAPDAGYVGLYAVTVANGQTSITSANIQQLATAPFIGATLTQLLPLLQTGAEKYADDTSSTANLITITLAPAIATIKKGQPFRVKIANTNTSSTVNMSANGMGNVQVINPDGSGPAVGQLAANGVYTFVFDGTKAQIQGIQATAANVYTGGTTTGSANAQVLASLSPANLTLTNGVTVICTAGYTNTGSLAFNAGGTGLITVKKDTGSGLALLTGGEVTATDTQFYTYNSTGSCWVLQAGLPLGALAYLGVGANLKISGGNLVNGNQRVSLTGNTTYNVSTTGNDTTGDGSSGAPWATIQHAVDYIANSVDLAGFLATVQLAAGTYTTGAAINSPFVGAGSNGGVLIQGDLTTPDNVTITTAGRVISASGAGQISIAGLKVATTGVNTPAIWAFQGGRINIAGNMDFGACPNTWHISAQHNAAAILVLSPYTISGSAQCHYNAFGSSEINFQGGLTFTLTGTPAFSQSFASAFATGVIYAAGATFTGAATGARYSATANGVIFTNGGGASFFPGSTAGSVATGGAYA